MDRVYISMDVISDNLEWPLKDVTATGSLSLGNISNIILPVLNSMTINR